MLANINLDTILDFAGAVLLALLTLIIGFYIANLLTRIARKRMEKREVDATVRKFLTSIINVGLKTLVVISSIATLGVDTTTFAAVLAAVGLAIGLALQGSLSNFAGGVLIVIFKPFQVGDFIKAQGYAGIVEEIQIFYTIIRTFDNQIVVMPNGQLSNSALTNVNKLEKRRVDMSFGVGYGDDIDKVRSVLERLVAECPNKLEDADHVVMLTELGDSSVNFAVRIWAETANYWGIYQHMLDATKKAFDAEGINIPYPTMDVNVSQPN